ncbi:LLM class flavin-dependent oxidoreductase [Streptomyces hirsutus]|uniref:LLM class flavin-dependent oxidoreductase n=1 Tax=Streptomyces hirsutus TaxID=35620 RepID=UPI00342485D4
MKLIYQMFFVAKPPELSDHQFYQQELRLAELAEPLGFDAIWVAEHHFDGDYCQCPDNFVVLSYLAAKTEKIGLGTAGAILPWNSPLRVAEKAIMLDVMSNGRFQFGVGRGLSKSEYDFFGIDMNESRERFEESMRMIIGAFKTGEISGDGPFYPQPPAPIRPGPIRDLSKNMVCIAMSSESRASAAELGLAITSFAQYPIERHAQEFAEYRTRYKEVHGKDAPNVIMSDNVFCTDDPTEHETIFREAMHRHYAVTVKHYGLDKSGHFDKIKGYGQYAELADAVVAAGFEAAADGYWQAQLAGTPDQIVDIIQQRYEVFGDYDQNCGFSVGGLSEEQVDKSVRLFSKEVIPRLKKLGIPFSGS